MTRGASGRQVWPCLRLVVDVQQHQSYVSVREPEGFTALSDGWVKGLLASPVPLTLALRANASCELTHLFCRLPWVYLFLCTRAFNAWGPDAVMSTVCSWDLGFLYWCFFEKKKILFLSNNTPGFCFNAHNSQQWQYEGWAAFFNLEPPLRITRKVERHKSLRSRNVDYGEKIAHRGRID